MPSAARPQRLSGLLSSEAGFEPPTNLTTRNGFRDRDKYADLQVVLCWCASSCANQQRWVRTDGPLIHERSEKLGQRERAMSARRNEEVLPVRRS